MFDKNNLSSSDTQEKIKELINNIVEEYMNNPGKSLSEVIKEYLPEMPMPIKAELENLLKNIDSNK